MSESIAGQAMIAVCAVTLATYVVLFGFGSYKLVAERYRIKHGHRALCSRFQVAASFCGIVGASLQLVMFGRPWVGTENADVSGEQDLCDSFMHAMTSFYLLGKFFADLFLFTRSAMVHRELRLHSQCLAFFRALVLTSTILCFLCVFLPLAMVYSHGLITDVGFCIAIFPTNGLNFSFAVADLMLGIAIFLMFIIPLWKTARRMAGIPGRASAISKSLYAIIFRNFVLSNIIFASGLVAVLSISFVFLYLNVNDPSSNNFFIVALLLGACDLEISVVVIHIMDQNWVPDFNQRTSKSHLARQIVLSADSPRSPREMASNITKLEGATLGSHSSLQSNNNNNNPARSGPASANTNQEPMLVYIDVGRLSELASIYFRLASELKKQGKLEEAAQTIQQCVEIRMRVLGEDHPRTIEANELLQSVHLQ